MPEYLSPGVYVQEESSGVKPIEGVGTSTACFVGAAARGRPFYPTFITSWSDYERLFGEMTKEADMPLAVYHFFLNGGKRAYVVRLLDPEAPVGVAKLSTEGDVGEVNVEAVGGGAWSSTLFVKVRLSNAGRDPSDPDADPNLPVLYDFVVFEEVDGEPQDLETIPRVGVKEDGERFYASIINRDSNYIRIDQGEAADFPQEEFTLEEVETADGKEQRAVAPLAGGDDGSAAKVFLPETLKLAFKELDVLDDVNILAIPGKYEADIVATGVAYVADRRDLIYVIDPPGDPRNRSKREVQLEDVAKRLKAMTKDSHAALYFPWIEVPDPYSQIPGATRFAPPSGAIAGLYARIDNRRGVWKAPAGTEATILGAVGVAVQVTDADQEILNPIGVNCIRQFPDAGIVVWGTRTIATRQDPEYRYVPVRRFAMFLAKSLYRGTQWVVFEPNDEPLWAAIRFNLNAFMLRQFRAGALQGSKPEEAYFVKCDAENNPQASIDAGEVHIIVGFAPLKPAEFVIIHLTQMRKE
ncbi:phage tail sheath family protein [Nannocystis punicea]|uniref:Phage tail sheath subtilisin-like domain-containing protein n=1 Tax=Nannocystis punicea TaxID=2995304 RepID=A0ABY7H744_9BACT|nr:phage tail sheath subtilisin-like domain-containing protein [Nannocystis poenicansa]WAS94824.1 phage tail sheath subtilisin-like domain-containing protein [Nannocystis poenicansa]